MLELRIADDATNARPGGTSIARTLNILFSHPCARRKGNYHGIISLQKNRGGGGVTFPVNLGRGAFPVRVASRRRNDLPIKEAERKYHWALGRRPDDHPGLSDLGF